MDRGKKPTEKIIVLSNSWLNKFEPDVEREFKTRQEAEKWIRGELEEFPDNMYVIYIVDSRFWAQINIRKA